MKVERKSGAAVREILTGMITSPAVLGAVAARWEDPGPFGEVTWANTVGAWCVKHYRRHGRPPGENIGVVFEGWANRGRQDDETVKLVERFLADLSAAYARRKKAVNPNFVLDLAEREFRKVRLRDAIAKAESALEDDDPKGAEDAFRAFSPPNLTSRSGAFFQEDGEAVGRAITHARKPLVTLPGAAGAFFGPALCRDRFVAFVAPEKRGKSMWLQDMAAHALRCRRRVAYFQVGDMSEEQFYRRLLTRFLRRPILSPGDPPVTVSTPITLAPPARRDGIAEVAFSEPVEYADPVPAKEVFRLVKKRLDKFGDRVLWTKTTSNNTCRVADAVEDLNDLERWHGWVPDVIVIDYADIVAPANGKLETRHQINETWMALRRLSQDLHALVLTATQADAASYDTELLGMKNFSEDKRKNAHCDGMVGLNQSDEEKEVGVYRLNWIAARDWPFGTKKCLYTAGSLALARPLMLATF